MTSNIKSNLVRGRDRHPSRPQQDGMFRNTFQSGFLSILYSIG